MMRIAVTTDQDFISSCFGCTPACTVVEIESGRICRTFIVPNPGWSHREWADFLERNAVGCLIVGNIGPNARAVLKWHGVCVVSGVQGSVDAVVEDYIGGKLGASDETSRGSGCGPSPAGCRDTKTA